MDFSLKYRKSGVRDINGIEIIEGSIINADGYNSDLKEHRFHCVEYEDGTIGSDIYSDFEPLSTYHKIEVVGHCEDFRKLYEQSRNYETYDEEDSQWSGNLGAVMKDYDDPDVCGEKSPTMMQELVKQILEKADSKRTEDDKEAFYKIIRVIDGDGSKESKLKFVREVAWKRVNLEQQ